MIMDDPRRYLPSSQGTLLPKNYQGRGWGVAIVPVAPLLGPAMGQAGMSS